MNDYAIGDQWSVYYDPNKALNDYRSFYESEGWQINSPTDPQLTADVMAEKQAATASGNTKLANTLDFILKYGDKALSILTTNGIIQNKNLVAKYPSYAGLLGGSDTDTTTTKDTSTNNAPATTNRVFNIDFTDPKVLIITFLLLAILFYFLFFNRKPKNGKR